MLDDNVINDLKFFTNIGMGIYNLYMRILKAYYVPAQIPDTLSPFLHRFFDQEDIKKLYCIKLTIMYIVNRYNISPDVLDNFNKMYNDQYDSHYENYKYNIDIQALLGVIKEICDTIIYLREQMVQRIALKHIDILQREEIGNDLQDLYTNIELVMNTSDSDDDDDIEGLIIESVKEMSMEVMEPCEIINRFDN